MANIDDMDEIKIIRNKSGDSSDSEEIELDDSFFKKVHEKLAMIGTVIINTYSEESQETGESFIEALKWLKEIKSVYQRVGLDNPMISVKERDGMLNLIKYLEGKLRRRLNATDDNVVNY